MKQRLASLLATAGLVAGLAFGGAGVPAVSAATNLDSLGTDFWLAFPGNFTGTSGLTLFLTGPTATTGTVAAPGAAFSTPFTVTPGTVTSVIVPSSLDIQTSDTVENLGIHVTANAEVTVYGLNRRLATTDAYLGLPTDILGTEYFVEGYKNSNVVNGTEFAVVAAQNGTTVTINPTVTTDGHTAGTPYTFNLDQGQTYQLRNADVAPADLSGSIVTSDKPIAVFGGHECANIPAGFVFCDHIVEEMTPTNTWGKSFVTEPLATRTGGDTFRFLADTDNTTVKVNGATVATLNRGQLFEQLITAASVITSDKPILVAQYSNSTSFDGVTSDPFEVLVPPFEQFLNSYTVTTPASGFDLNFINVVAPTASLGTVKLDGVVIPGGSFTAIPGSTFSGAGLAVALGSHTLDGAQPFGVIVYGFAVADSYGYPGGLSLAPVATVTSVTLAPKDATNPINTEHCVTATVKDQNSNPVVGVRVDFTVTGVNPTTSFTNTEADGTAKFCYTGTNTGDDSIVAAVGTINDTATKHWTGGGEGGTISALGDAHGWIGLRNSDDQGTQFDLRVELLKNGTPVESGIKRCITGLTRNPLLAKETLVAWNFSPVSVTTGDVLSVRFSARIGTNLNNTKCSGPGGSHNSAVGLRLYYDAASRNSHFAATIGANPSADLYLHSDGGACDKPSATLESQGVTKRFLNTTAPGAVPAKCKDSGVVNFAGGNTWSIISTWFLAPLS